MCYPNACPSKQGAKGKQAATGKDKMLLLALEVFSRQPESSGVSWPLLAAVTNYSVTQSLFLWRFAMFARAGSQLCWISHREPPVPQRSLPLSSSSWSLLSAGYGWDTQLLQFSPLGFPRYLNPTQLKQMTALSIPLPLKQAPAVGLIQYVNAKSDSRKGGISSAGNYLKACRYILACRMEMEEFLGENVK